MSAEEIKDQLNQFRSDFLRLRQEIAKVIVGQDEIVEGTMGALIAGGHVLLEGVPGLQIDATHSGPSASASMIIAHAVLPPGMYRVVEHTGDVVKNVSADTAADLIAVFVFGAKSLSPQ